MDTQNLLSTIYLSLFLLLHSRETGLLPVFYELRNFYFNKQNLIHSHPYVNTHI